MKKILYDSLSQDIDELYDICKDLNYKAYINNTGVIIKTPHNVYIIDSININYWNISYKTSGFKVKNTPLKEVPDVIRAFENDRYK